MYDCMCVMSNSTPAFLNSGEEECPCLVRLGGGMFFYPENFLPWKMPVAKAGYTSCLMGEPYAIEEKPLLYKRLVIKKGLVTGSVSVNFIITIIITT